MPYLRTRMHPKLARAGVVTAVALASLTGGVSWADDPALRAPAPLPGDLLPTVAPPYAGPDAVHLEGGAVMQGTIVEIVPNDHVTLRLPGGQSTVIEWRKVVRMVGGAEAAMPGAAAPPQSGRAARAPVVDVPGKRVWVHIEAGPSVTLEAATPGSERWERVCAAPCDAWISLGMGYRVAGEDVRPSAEFAIDARPGQTVDVVFHPGSGEGFGGGVMLVALGLIGTVVSAGGLSVSSIGSSDSSAESGAVAGLVASLAVTTLGAVFLATNARSTATVKIEDASPPARPQASWLRVPVWREGARLAGPRTLGLPLFTRSF